MKRIAILGGGISGLTAAYELEQARKRGAEIDWHLYEATNRLGGIISTTRHSTPEGDFILENGPDGWVSEKPWARELAIELGLEDELIHSNDATRKTYILRTGKLEAIPDGMRMMVPTDLSVLDGSPLFSTEAKLAYAAEPGHAEELKAQAPDTDESVASFVRRHFGDEVLETLAAPLLSGVFGGDVHKLSVRAVMPQFVAMEREHGSLILALQAKSAQSKRAQQPIFTSLRSGMGSLVDALVATLPAERIHRNLDTCVQEEGGWKVMAGRPFREFLCFVHYRTRSEKDIFEPFDEIVLATPLDVTKQLLHASGAADRALLPQQASSAILTAFVWPAETANTFNVPPGFGFLAPQGKESSGNELLACTFVDQKFPHRVPADSRIIRTFFGGSAAASLEKESDETIAGEALAQLRQILGGIPEPSFQTVQRLPNSLPQYEVGHLDRIAELEGQIASPGGLTLLGNSYHGVGIPDLIRDARAAARKLISDL
ncbi:MAG TPA: protoporphyrinogen oxidase [Acidobacteriaceae bacterium]|jgi:oxygen-dependent protoporphyrinogen oxidase